MPQYESFSLRAEAIAYAANRRTNGTNISNRQNGAGA